MACRVLELVDGGAILMSSTSETALPPIFNEMQEAHEFLWWLAEDPRGVEDIITRLALFRAWRPDHATKALLTRIQLLIDADGELTVSEASKRWSLHRLIELRKKGLLDLGVATDVRGSTPITLTARGDSYRSEFC